MKLKEIKEYYFNRKLLYRYFEDENGVPEGVFERYYENGQLAKKSFFKNGILEGVQEWYHEDGQLSSKYFYKNGVQLTPEEYRKLKMEKLKNLIKEVNF